MRPSSTAWINPVATLCATLLAIAVPPSAHAQSPLDGIRTVFVIVMENQNWSRVQGSVWAPYINGTLLTMASHAQTYFSAPVHPSLPNYLWMEAGTSFGIQADVGPSDNAQDTADHLVSQLSAAGIDWKSYQEGIPGTDCPLLEVLPYTPRHNPFVYFTDVTNGNDIHSANCIRHVRPYSELASDLAAGTVPRYAFITPNLCNDGHDVCEPRANPVAQTDAWLAENLPVIMNSQAYRAGGAIFITWDEGSNDEDGPIGMIVLSPFAKGYGYSNSIPYDHGSLLRTLQEIFHVTPLLGAAAHRISLTDFFQPVATPPPACTLEAVPPSTLLGGSITLTARCEPAATSYAWTPAPGLIAGVSNMATVVPGTTGTFHYAVTGINGSGTGNSATTSVVVTTATTSDSVAEFYNASLDHYFMTVSLQEMSDLDNGVRVGWTRTGLGFRAYSAPGVGANPVCRFYLPPAQGDSHFYSASPTECAETEAKFPAFILESSNSMYMGLPDVTTGACTAGSIPVYRVWDNRADSNHRYTTDRVVRDQMIAKGWIGEGYGPDRVIMCSPL